MPVGFRPGFTGIRPGFGVARPGFAVRSGFGARGFLPGFLVGTLVGSSLAPQYYYPPCPYWDPYCLSYYQ